MLKRWGAATGLMLLVAGWVNSAKADEVASCFEEGRNTDLCLQMRHMRNLLHGLESQKELMQVDYSYLACMSDELDGLLTRILRTASGNSHVQPLEDIRSIIRLTRRRAEEQNLEVFRLLGHIQNHCQRCHSESSAPGRRWEDLSKASWMQIAVRCNQPERNPYLCRQMYGMLAQVQILESGVGLGTSRFETLAAAASELERIASELIRLGGVHGGVTEPLEQIRRESAELKALATARNPEAFPRAAQIISSCRQCHTSGEVEGGVQ